MGLRNLFNTLIGGTPMESFKNAVELKGGLNGLKMLLGAALIVLAHQIQALRDLIPLFPDSAHFLQVLMSYLQGATDVVQKVINILGEGFLGVGFLHKIWKLFKSE